MIILIGGCSHINRKKIAKALNKKYKIPYLGLDYLNNNGLLPIIYGLIEQAIKNDQTIIIYGLNISPSFISTLNNDIIGNSIPILLCSSENYILNNFKKTEIPSLIIENKLFKESCKINNLDLFEKDDNSNEFNTEIMEYIDSGIFL